MTVLVHIDIIQAERSVGHLHLSPLKPLEIGREGADRKIADPGMSRRHFVLTQVGDTVTVQDLGSSGGTFVNGEPIGTEPHPLATGDRIEAGDTAFLIQIDAVSSDYIHQTSWRVRNVPEGFVLIEHLGLRRDSNDEFAETVICKEDELAESPGMAEYAALQCERLKLLAPDLAVTDAGPLPELAPLESSLLRMAFTYNDKPINQWHVYIRRGQRIGIAVWTFKEAHSGEREQVRRFLECLDFEEAAAPTSAPPAQNP